MPWIWQDANGGSRTRRRRRARVQRRSRNYSDSYGNSRRRNRRNDMDGWDGQFYDQDGAPIRLTIATPGDMLPPARRAAELDDGNWPVNRYGYRERF